MKQSILQSSFLFLVIICDILLVTHAQVYSNKVDEVNAISQHNQKRAVYNSPPLLSDSSLSENAERCALKMAEGRLPIAIHPCQEPGENIYQTTMDLSYPIISDNNLIKDAVEAWYAEKIRMKTINYNVFDEKWLVGMSNNDLLNTGHFMQIIWKSVRSVGCAVSYYTTEVNRVYYVLCRYSPAPYLKVPSERITNLPSSSLSMCEDSPGCQNVANAATCQKYEKTREKCKKSCKLC
ncbi:cysteine-rich secretory protein 2 isoform X2 [Hydra vulgaris]|uniref:Cysteine-rich secretory protein 2 isoform X2 n=2 Tax=Hydra vulgaris TaxID=6087 RepID=A0ABM4BXU5_HYDVU